MRHRRLPAVRALETGVAPNPPEAGDVRPESPSAPIPPQAPGGDLGATATRPGAVSSDAATEFGAPRDETPFSSDDVPTVIAAFDEGDVIEGRYVVGSLLASGGMGQVYTARDVLLDRPVALKALHPDIRRRIRPEDHCAAEARTLSRLQHPNIVQVHSFGMWRSRWFLVMELVDGMNLWDRLREPVSVANTSHVVRQVAEALSHAHERGVVHGDIKPQNILVSRVGRDPLFVRVVDFGIARVCGALTSSGEADGWAGAGTPRYMAPEQIEGRRLDGATDQYALALVAYEMLADTHPFPQRESYALLLAHRDSTPPPVSSVAQRHRFGARTDDVIGRALSKNPSDRYASCVQFAEALEDALRAEAVLEVGASWAGTAGIGAATLRGAHTVADAPSGWREVAIVACAVTVRHAEGRRLYRGEAQEVWSVFHERASRCTAGLGGRPTSLIAGRMLVVFGSAQGGRDAARAAVAGGLALEATARELERDPTLGVDVSLEIRVGVDAGPALVSAGDVLGSGTLDGPAVEGALALLDDARPGEVIATRRATRLTDGGFETEAREGRGVRVMGRSDRSTRVEDPLLPDAPLVGRADDLAALERVLRVVQGCASSMLVAIVGPPGIGKTRLVRELTDRAAGSARVVSARSSPERGGGPYEALADVARLLAAPGEPLEEQIARVLGEPDAAAGARRVLRLLGLGGRAAAAGALRDPYAAQEHALAVRDLGRWIASHATERCLIVHLEDLQWAGAAAAAAVGSVVRQTTSAPVLFVACLRPGTGRDVLTSVGLPPDLLHVIRLLPLEPLDVDALMEALGVGGESGDELASAREATGGVPLLVEELAAALLENPGAHEAERTADDLVLARIETLVPDQRRALERLAVVGLVGWRELVDPERTVGPDGWRRLAMQRLVREESAGRIPGMAQVAFRSAVTRDAIYRNLEPAWRDHEHLRVGGWLEEHAAAHVGPEPILLHLLRGGADERALPWALQAGHRAMDGHAGEEALAHFALAVELVGRAAEPERHTEALAEAYLGCALAASFTSRPQRGVEWLDRAAADRRLGSDAEDGLLGARLLLRRADLQSLTGDAEGALVTLERASLLAAREGGALFGLVASARRAMTLAQRGDYVGAQEVADTALAAPAAASAPAAGVRTAGERAEWSRALGTLHGALGHAWSRRGALEKGEHHYARSSEFWDAAEQVVARATAMLNLGLAAWWRGDGPTARDRWTRALDLYLQGGALHGAVWCRINLADEALLAGDPERCLTLTAAARADLAVLATTDNLAEIARIEAEAHLAAGRAAEALTHGDEAVTAGASAGRPAQLGSAHMTRGRVLVALGRSEEAQADLRAAARCFTESGQAQEAAKAEALLASVEQQAE